MYRIFENIEFLKEKFSSLFQMQKKVKALERYSDVGDFYHRDYLGLIKNCMETDFLGDEENRFLDHMLKKYEINYLDWCHKTRWLKNEMQRVSKERKSKNIEKAMHAIKPIQTDLFDFSIRKDNFKIPMSAFHKKINIHSARM
jgi:hypothetical protein